MTPATLEEIYIRTSRCGNTTALVAFAKAHGAIVVVHDAHEEARVRALGAKAVSIQRGPRAFLGTTAGYVIDLPVFAAVSREWEAAISARRAAERECDEQRVRAEVAERRARTAEDRAAALATVGARKSELVERLREMVAALLGDADPATVRAFRDTTEAEYADVMSRASS